MYKSTGSWLVYVIIIIIVIGIIGIVVIAFSAVTTFASNPSLFRANNTIDKLYRYFAISGMFVKPLLGSLRRGIRSWCHPCGNLVFRVDQDVTFFEKTRGRIVGAKDNPGRKLVHCTVGLLYINGANWYYFILQQLLSNIMSPSTLPNFGGVNSTLAPYSYLALGGYWLLLFLVSFGGTVVQIVGSYLVYSGLGSVTRAMQIATPPPPFPSYNTHRLPARIVSVPSAEDA